MNVHALIIEQLEWDRKLKSFTLQAQHDFGQMWVAFPNEYEDERSGPYHFLDKNYENLFEQKKAKCKTAILTSEKFSVQEEMVTFRTIWNGIPTQRNNLTFYSLYLPEFAVPDEIIITDTYQPEKLFNKTVYRDDIKKRYIIHLECRSNKGIFNFNLRTRFHEDAKNFIHSKFNDNETVGFYEYPIDENWHHLLQDKEVEKVSNYFAEQIVINKGKETNQTFKLNPTKDKKKFKLEFIHWFTIISAVCAVIVLLFGNNIWGRFQTQIICQVGELFMLLMWLLLKQRAKQRLNR